MRNLGVRILVKGTGLPGTVTSLRREPHTDRSTLATTGKRLDALLFRLNPNPWQAFAENEPDTGSEHPAKTAKAAPTGFAFSPADRQNRLNGTDFHERAISDARSRAESNRSA